VDTLLRSISWSADKLIRRRGNFPSVLWLTEDAAGGRKTYDTPCIRAPDSASDAELLVGLATDFAIDLAEAPTRVTKFAVAYLGNRVTTTRPLDPASSMQPKTVRRKGVVIELHGDDAHLRFFLEILRSSGGKSMLGPVEPLTEPFEGPYSNVLERADKWRNKDAAAKVEAKAAAKVQIAAKPKVAVRESSAWPPRFLTKLPRDARVGRVGEHG
jgi:hypothetical protein